ncbi:arginine--tRNA ligase [Candidatus Woesearchaeota archaeon]|nr:arginine--tRNA ligase [Candidatus Woesearchaeota archaeon]
MDAISSAVALLKKHLSVEKVDSSLIEVPRDHALGDLAYPCFIHAKELKKAPQVIAKEGVEHITKAKSLSRTPFSKITAVGPYINFFVDSGKLAATLLSTIIKSSNPKSKALYGKGMIKRKVMVEYASPNTNKPLHLGHVRNISLGHSVSKLLDFQGMKVIQVNINNDRGVHICKSMLAYQKWGKNAQPDIKTDHFVGKFYVLFSDHAKDNPAFEEEAQDLLRKWEAGDKETIKVWKLMNAWAYNGFEETYAKLGVAFDKYYYESEIYKEGKKIVMDGLKKKIFYKNKDGAVVADIPGLDTKVLLRSDGTSVYITQDLYLATLKAKESRLDSSIYVVANEQNYHFQVLFKLLKILEYSWADKCHHLSYGMVYLPHGKMKSREGTVVDADDIIENMKDLARVEIRKRYHDLTEAEVDQRAMIIGLGALKFYLLKIDPNRDMHFNPEESISFEGETGPYVQYAHARICSVIRKWKEHAGKNAKLPLSADAALLREKQEETVTKLLSQFPDITKEAAELYRPSVLCRYLLDLSQAFNEFYHTCPVVAAHTEELRDARLLLCEAVRIVLHRGLYLLGIEAPEEM